MQVQRTYRKIMSDNVITFNRYNTFNSLKGGAPTKSYRKQIVPDNTTSTQSSQKTNNGEDIFKKYYQSGGAQKNDDEILAEARERGIGSSTSTLSLCQ